MLFFDIPKQPYLDTPSELGGGADPIPQDPPSDPTPPVDPPAQDPPDPKLNEPEPFLSIKYNKEEMPLTKEEVVELAQKGKNYDKIYEKYNQLQNNPGLSYLNKLAEENGVTVEQLVNHWEQQQKEQERQELLDQGIDPDMLYSALDKHPVMQQAKQVLFEKQMANFKDKPFFNELQPQVSQMLQNTPGMDVNTAYSFLLGQTLLNGGMEKLTAQYQERISQLEKGIQVQGKNTENAGNSTGSVTGQGEVGNDFISQESFERNKNDRSWVVKNLTNIQTSRKKW